MSGTLHGTPRIRIPAQARPGETIEVRVLMDHPMETGLPHGDGTVLPRDMIARLEVRRDGALLFAADLANGTAANPYHVFHVRMERSAEFTFTWTDERGRSARAVARVAVG